MADTASPPASTTPDPYRVASFAEYVPLALGTEAPTINFVSQIVQPVPKGASMREAIEGVPAADPFSVWPVASEQSLDALFYNGPLIRLLHGSLGLATEAGEIMTAWMAHRHGSDKVDLANVKEEIGDAFWYVAILCDAIAIEPNAVDGGYEIVRKQLKGKGVSLKIGGYVDGLCARSLKLVEFLKKRLFYPKALDPDEIFVHVGESIDILLYLTRLFGFDLADVLSANLRKLNVARYPNGFETAAANDRDTGAEMAQVGGMEPGQFEGSEQVYMDDGRLVDSVPPRENADTLTAATYAQADPTALWYPGYGFRAQESGQ